MQNPPCVGTNEAQQHVTAEVYCTRTLQTCIMLLHRPVARMVLSILRMNCRADSPSILSLLPAITACGYDKYICLDNHCGGGDESMCVTHVIMHYATVSSSFCL